MSSDFLRTADRVGILCKREGREIRASLSEALDLYGCLPKAVRDQLARMQVELTETERRRVYSEIYDALEYGLCVVRSHRAANLNHEENANERRLL